MTYSSPMWTKLLTVVELTTFLRSAAKIWSDEERVEFVDYVAGNPEAGDVIPDTGGLRKVRWGRQGGGKRGGVRVVYYYYNMDTPLYLIIVYAKAAREDLSPEEKRTLSALAAELKRAAAARKEVRS